MRYQNLEWGVRDLEAVIAVASDENLILQQVKSMLANIFSIFFQEISKLFNLNSIKAQNCKNSKAIFNVISGQVGKFQEIKSKSLAKQGFYFWILREGLLRKPSLKDCFKLS